MLGKKKKLNHFSLTECIKLKTASIEKLKGTERRSGNESRHVLRDLGWGGGGIAHDQVTPQKSTKYSNSDRSIIKY